MNARSPALSRTEMTELVLPTHANALGNIFGGQILAWLDIASAICAQRHCGAVVVTAGIDDLAFEKPVKVGQVVHVQAVVTAAFRTSVEVFATVHGEEASTRERWLCVSAFLTFVAIDATNRPVVVPALEPTTDEERARERDGVERRAYRLARRNAPRPSR